MAAGQFVGEIRMLGCNFAPRQWSFCNGQLVSIASNTALFSLLGTQYGGDGRTTFGLPDLQGRTPMNYGPGLGLTNRDIGESGGTENVSLTTAQMPQHNHVASTTASEPCRTSAGNTDRPELAFPAQNATAEVFSSTSNASMGAISVTTTLANNGGNQAHENLPPYLCVNFCIATQGIFPARN
jgi:microcystin-dependent protein